MSTCDSENEMKHVDKIVHNISNGDELATVYTDWANTYNEDMLKPNAYHGFMIIPKLLDLFSYRDKERRILDIGAGTGLVAIQLKKMGYQNIDALEPNEAMIKKAMEKNLYKNYIIEKIEHDKPMKLVKEETYDRLTAAGCFSPGHMDYRYIRPIMNLLKPGGYFIFGFRNEYIHTHQKEVLPEIRRLESENIIKVNILTEIPDYYPGVSGFMTVLMKV